jgi:hypothetical protein
MRSRGGAVGRLNRSAAGCDCTKCIEKKCDLHDGGCHEDTCESLRFSSSMDALLFLLPEWSLHFNCLPLVSVLSVGVLAVRF